MVVGVVVVGVVVRMVVGESGSESGGSWGWG